MAAGQLRRNVRWDADFHPLILTNDWAADQATADADPRDVLSTFRTSPRGIRLDDGDQPHILARYLTARSFSPSTLCGFPPPLLSLSFVYQHLYPPTTYKPAIMARTDKVVSTPYNAAIQEFLNSNATPKRLRQRAAALLSGKELLRNVRGLTPEDQSRFVDKLDQVCRNGSFFFIKIPFIISTKAYPTISPRDAKFVTALGNVCSATERLPTSAVLSTGLKKVDDIPIESGGMGDIWQGQDLRGLVAIKALRIHPAQNLKSAKEVRIQAVLEVYSRIKFTDSVETGTSVEEAIP